ncbi:hypothetical protein [Paenibacillus donghaensis]|uniref:ABC transporter permease n=1 Tax=Paenibacillus donghaensis TaxID=414771 RepID=A0A2Z2KHV1_9BACL|nr:hypothetical protein [Paenibacillus donghaensis]ASA25477.1 hypothetical protein B9T62_34955 [Paenibacillus donghaensis]
MRTVKDAWMMVQSEYRGNKLKLVWASLFSIFYMGYIAFFVGIMMNEIVQSNEGHMAVDIMLLSITPLMGFVLNRSAFKYWSEDSYTRMLVYFKSLPIPATVILCKRKIMSVIAFSINGTLCFGLIYAFSKNMRAEMDLGDYIAFTITWIGYGLIVTGLYITFELLFSGKIYLVLTLAVLIVAFGVAFLVQMGGGNLFLYTILCSQEWGLLSPLMWGTLLVGMASVQVFSKWTIHRLKSRDLL